LFFIFLGGLGVGAKARRVLTPPSPEKLKIVRDLVAAATGFSQERGDQLIVETLPFDSTLRIEPPPAAMTPPPAAAPLALPLPFQNYLKNMNPAMMVGIGIGILAVLLGLPVLMLLSRRKKRSRGDVTSAAALPAGVGNNVLDDAGAKLEEKLASHAAAQQKLEADALNSLRLPAPQTKKGEVLAKHLRDSAKKDPMMVAQLIRTWLHEEAR
jgi:flagellar M-ring protein FliF